MNRLILDMPAEQYHAHPAISKSGLDQLALCPKKYKWYRENGNVQTDAMAFGSAFHTLLLEPQKFPQYVAVEPAVNRRTTAGKAEYEAFQRANEGKAIIGAEDLEEMKLMAESIRDTASARYLLKGTGKIEPSLFWKDAETGVECRARPDWLRDDGLLVDLKTTICAEKTAFMKHAFSMRYHVQAAFYMEAYRRVTRREPEGFAFIAVEKKAPYCVCAFRSEPEFIELGVMEYREALASYADCLKKDEWPGYPDETLVPLTLPIWAKQLVKGDNYYGQ